MNENEPRLLEALKSLAAEGPHEAPARVEERLLAEFRRRSRLRRRTRWWPAAGVAAVAAGIAGLLWIHPAPPKSAPAAAQAKVPELPKTAVAATAPTPPKTSRIRTARVRSETVAMSFYPLPDAYQLPPVENATVVRVQLRMSSLRLIGLPVSEERAGERIQADVLLGQDGLARAVRFVQ